MIMPITVKKVLSLLLIGFLLFFVLQSPVEAGTIVRNLLGSLSDFFVSSAQSFSTFLRTLF